VAAESSERGKGESGACQATQRSGNCGCGHGRGENKVGEITPTDPDSISNTDSPL
jgi:hypothetical protein